MTALAYYACYCSINYSSGFNCPAAETTTLEITHKLKIVQPRSVMNETNIF